MDTRTATAAVVGALTGAVLTLAALWATLYRGQALVDGYAEGGRILGPIGDDPDRVPAWLSEGGPVERRDDHRPRTW